jgi:Fe2+ or Zn2+ uptake regulation protein
MKNTIRSVLIKYNVHPTKQRIKVYDFLIKNPAHPSAEEIFRGVYSEKNPISLATIYNTLKLFEESGLIRTITLGDGKSYYDAFLHSHAHFYSLEDGKIHDLELNDQAIKDQLPPEMEAKLVNIVIYGNINK